MICTLSVCHIVLCGWNTARDPHGFSLRSEQPRRREPAKKRLTGLACVLVALQILLPFLYVASIGPAFCLQSSGYFTYETFESVYAPLMRVYFAYSKAAAAFDFGVCGSLLG